jgi:putative ATP-dependent endonuclease of OLD family
MIIKSITIQNFRCFGPKVTTIPLDNLTVFVGSNGAGKTAILLALARLFGVTAAERRLEKNDFHVPANESDECPEERRLMIEARIEFPELDLEEEEGLRSVPPSFSHMAAEQDGRGFCRIRLEGTWSRSSLLDGDIDEKLWWIQTAGEVTKEDQKQVMKSVDRSRIQVVYVPASRDPSRQLRSVAGTLLARILGAVSWSPGTRTTLADVARQITKSMRSEPGIENIEAIIEDYWQSLQDDARVARPRFQFARGQLADVLRQTQVLFGSTSEGELDIDHLSDGLRSLFYFALVGAVFEIEQKAAAGTKESKPEAAAIDADQLSLPVLTIFAVEEPENHLAPHYLSRLMQLFERLVRAGTAQIVLTSHSASILRRVDPQRVRHCRMDLVTRTTIVKSIVLPDEKHEAAKFVRQAVRAYPELYFSRLIILGEGDSEEVVLPRLAESHDLLIDSGFISVVPLGGRHVNHFWRLLSNLDVPYVTLLDLDRGREGGGWGRIKYVCEQLLAIGKDQTQVLAITPGDDGIAELSTASFKGMHTWNSSEVSSMDSWVQRLAEFDVFFSAPLDLDFLMLCSFPEVYQDTAPKGGGPRGLKKDATKQAERISKAVVAVLGEQADAALTYSEEEQASLPWYQNLFLGHGKPSTHLLALASMTTEELRDGTPPALAELITRVKAKLFFVGR